MRERSDFIQNFSVPSKFSMFESSSNIEKPDLKRRDSE